MRFGLNKNSRLEIHDSFPIKITTSITLKFRTLHADGLIFYASDARFNDFLAIWLQEGYVNYAFDLGSGQMHLKTNQKYNDGRFHTLGASRDMQSGLLVMSDRRNRTIVETIEGHSKGKASSLSIAEPYYFGGLPDTDKQRLPAKQIGMIVTDPFIGCMSDFTIAHNTIRNRLQKIELMSCANNHESGMFFTGSSLTSYAQLPGFINLKDAYEISFEFKSRTQNGVVLYIGSKHMDAQNYVLVELINGELNYKLNIDGTENTAKFSPKFSRNELCNSNWIRVQIKKTVDGHISLRLKGTEATSSFDDQMTLDNDLVTDVFIGALPVRSKYADITQTNEPFVGCIRDLSVLRANTNYNSKVLLQMTISDGVLAYCPLK